MDHSARPRPPARPSPWLAAAAFAWLAWALPALLIPSPCWAGEAGPGRPPGLDVLPPAASLDAPDPVRLPLHHLEHRVALEDGFVATGTVVADAALAEGAPAGAEGLRRLRVIEVTGDGAYRLLPEPPGRARFRAEPLPLVAPDGTLAGLAWLEGDDPGRSGVSFAAWDGTAWGPVRAVAEPGPGTQMALAGAVLADGTPLLLWSAFDGEDDEILWSLARGTSWSQPRRLGPDDRVPDITPAVRSSGDGALAAWSEFGVPAPGRAGEYRVMVSRLEVRGPEATWGPARAVGPPGSLFPSWARPGGDESAEPLLLLRTAHPRGWQAVELGSGDTPRRRARVSLKDLVTGTASATGAAESPTAPAGAPGGELPPEERARLLSPAQPPQLEIRSDGLVFVWPTAGPGGPPSAMPSATLQRTVPWEISP